jgi:hypothetical protein
MGGQAWLVPARRCRDELPPNSYARASPVVAIVAVVAVIGPCARRASD